MPVITFSRVYPSYHPKKGQPTYFMEKIWSGLADKTDMVMDEIDFSKVDFDFHQYYNGVPKWHTIRAGRRWKVGQVFSPRVWNGKPYNSKQTTFAPDIEIKQIYDFEIRNGEAYISGKPIKTAKEWIELAKNDGLTVTDMEHWFKIPCNFEGQIICWNDKINY